MVRRVGPRQLALCLLFLFLRVRNYDDRGAYMVGRRGIAVNFNYER